MLHMGLATIIRFLVSVRWGRSLLGAYLGRHIVEPGYEALVWAEDKVPDAEPRSPKLVIKLGPLRTRAIAEDEDLRYASTATTTERLVDSLPLMMEAARVSRGCLYSPWAIAYVQE